MKKGCFSSKKLLEGYKIVIFLNFNLNNKEQ